MCVLKEATRCQFKNGVGQTYQTAAALQRAAWGSHGTINKGTGTWEVNSITPLHTGCIHTFIIARTARTSKELKIDLGKINSVGTLGTATLVREAEQIRALSLGKDHNLHKRR